MLLTLSIGLVSINLPLTVKAQNSVLSQSGNGVSEQETKQGQTSEQDNQVVSGESSLLSGNNLGCQNQDNSSNLSVLSNPCELPFISRPETSNRLLITMFIDNSERCRPLTGDRIGNIVFNIMPRQFADVSSGTSVIVKVLENLPPVFTIDFHSTTTCMRGDVKVTVSSSSGPLVTCASNFKATCAVRMPESNTSTTDSLTLDVIFPRN
jgi:hypothetical protein